MIVRPYPCIKLWKIIPFSHAICNVLRCIGGVLTCFRSLMHSSDEMAHLVREKEHKFYIIKEAPSLCV